MSEQKPDQSNGDFNGVSSDLGPVIPDAPGVAPAEPAKSAMPDVVVTASPRLIPAAGEAAETPKVDPAKADLSNAAASRIEPPKAAVPPPPSKIMIMPPRDESWNGDRVDQDSSPGQRARTSGMFGKRRLSALVAVAALAAVFGAIGGALATAGFGHLVTGGGDTKVAANRAHALEESVTRMEAELAALKASADRTAKLHVTQFGKANDRLDKVEKAQIEPAAKLAKMGEALEKLEKTRLAAAAPAAVVPVPAVAPAPAKEVTASISTAAAAPTAPASTTPVPAAKPEVGRLPTVDGWVLRDVARGGGAVIEGRQGIYEVYAGDPVPGLGRVDAIRKQDGRWVVITSRGLIVGR